MSSNNPNYYHSGDTRRSLCEPTTRATTFSSATWLSSKIARIRRFRRWPTTLLIRLRPTLTSKRYTIGFAALLPRQ